MLFKLLLLLTFPAISRAFHITSWGQFGANAPAPQCLEYGAQCYDGQISYHESYNTLYDCLDLCKETQGCSWVSWGQNQTTNGYNTNLFYCYLYEECLRYHYSASFVSMPTDGCERGMKYYLSFTCRSMYLLAL